MRSKAFFAILFLAACGTPEAPSTPEKTAPPGAVERIRAQEETLFKGSFDQRGALALLGVYQVFVDSFPQDTMAPEYLFRAAGLSKALNQPQQSVQFYDRIIAGYPGWRRIISTYYMKAFTLDDGLNDTAAAHAAYQQVIDRFPDHPFANESKAAIANLPYSDEELIARFKRMNPDTAGIGQ